MPSGNIGRLVATVWLVCAPLGGALSQTVWPPLEGAAPERPEIKAQKKPDSGLETEKHAKTDQESSNQNSAAIMCAPACALNGEAKPKASEGHEEGTEFWPPLFGYRIKITDSLLAVFTGLLWWSTQALVRGADNTAKHQLRAYVLVEEATKIFDRYDRFSVKIGIKNYGQTPARNVVVNRAATFSALVDEDKLGIPDFCTSKTILGPGGALGASAVLDGEITPIYDPLELADAGVAIFIHGEIRYEDIFGCKQVTCFRLKHVGSGSGESIQPCESGNTAT